MTVRSRWFEEFWRILLLVGVAWAVGALFDQVLLFLLLALLAYALRNLFNLHRLASWLGDPQVARIPIEFGLWGDIYSRISRISSRQEQREGRLKSMLNEYASSTSALPDATVALDHNDRIVWFNDAASSLLGLRTAKDIGQPLTNLFRNPEVAEMLRKRDFRHDLQTTAPGNAGQQLEVRINPYGEGQILLIARDITERLRQDRIRKDFVANVSHELRTPLTVLSGFVENLQGAQNLGAADLQRPLEVMAQQTARMRQIVEDLLLLARLESTASLAGDDPVPIADLLTLVAEDCATLKEQAPRVEVDIDTDRQVRGDEGQLRSAITNLAVNAVHHTPVDGLVRLCWRLEGDEGVVEVVDTGEGIAPEHIARLTERFYRVDSGRSRERGGTGLGLAIVKHVLNRHQAKLQIRSQPGKGSAFSIRFPASRLVS